MYHLVLYLVHKTSGQHRFISMVWESSIAAVVGTHWRTGQWCTPTLVRPSEPCQRLGLTWSEPGADLPEEGV